MSPRLHRAALAACTATALLGLAACASGGATATTAVPAATASTAAAPAPTSASPTDPTAGMPNGPKLKAALLPAADVPHSLKANPRGSQDSGDPLGMPSTGPAPTAKDCTHLSDIPWIQIAGISGDAFAGSDFTDSYSDDFNQEIDVFEGNTAATVMSRVKQLFASCAHFHQQQDGSTHAVTLTTKHLTGLGDDAVQGVLTSPDFQGGETLIAVRVGSFVVSTLYNDQRTTGGADLALTEALVKRLKSTL